MNVPVPAGGPHVKVFRIGAAAGGVIYAGSFFAYDPGFSGGVNVALGDLNGDGLADVLTNAGPGGGPHVKAFDGRTGAVLRSFMRAGRRFFVGDMNVPPASPRPEGAVLPPVAVTRGPDSCHRSDRSAVEPRPSAEPLISPAAGWHPRSSPCHPPSCWPGGGHRG
jgi:hypothetical protein